jgi:hypothetical protein
MMVSQNGEWLNAILNISVPIVHVKAERLDFLNEGVDRLHGTYVLGCTVACGTSHTIARGFP